MRLDEFDPAGGTPVSADDDRSYNAVVTSPPQGADPGEVWVTIPQLGQYRHGPCRYQPVPGVTPAPGDRCLVVKGDGAAEWWIVQFDERDVTAADLLAQIAVLEAKVFEPVFITPVSLFSHTNGTVTWATVSVAASTGADTARFALVRALVGGARTAATYATNALEFRKTGSSGPVQRCEHRQTGTGSATVGSGHTEHLIVPLDGSEQFDYQRIDGLAASSQFEAVLEGYVK